MMSREKTLGIIGAMESEISLLLSKMENSECETVGMHTFFIGALFGRRIVLARAGVGKVNAAICANTMILRYSPDAIINIGVAGALSPELSLGDVVISSSTVEHDLDYGSLGDPRGCIFFGEGRQLVAIESDVELKNALFSASKRREGGEYHTFSGLVASGDVFVSSTEARDEILSYFPNALCCEMEGAAIAHACFMHSVPCSVIRSISDGANSSSDIDFPTFVKLAADRAAGIIEEFVGDNN